MENKSLKPKIRFKGFTEAWEQRKLLEVANYRNGKAHENDIDENGKYIVVNSKFVSTEGEIKKYSNKQNEPLEQNDIAFVLSDVPNGRAIAKTFLVDKSNKYTLNQRIAGITPHDNINPKYLAITMNRNKYFLQFDDGVKQTNLSLEDMKKYESFYPEKKEQDKLGNTFETIDNLITLHQRKCDKLVNIKKSLLEKMFPKNGNNVPEIRFKGFTEAWEQRKVTDVGKIFIGLVTTMTKNYTDVGTLLIRNSDIKDNHFEFDSNPIHLDEGFAKSNDSRRMHIGDVVTVHTGDVGTSAVITEKEDGSIGFATIVTRPNKEIIDSNYLSTYLNTEQHKNWAINQSTGDGRTNYNLKEFTQLIVPLPSLKEQQCISKYIKQIDNLITLHQKKLNKLKNIKKSLLDKMFV